jgi:hypothetical protein
MVSFNLLLFSTFGERDHSTSWIQILVDPTVNVDVMMRIISVPSENQTVGD